MIWSMERRITGGELRRMRELAALGNLTDERVLDPAAWLDNVEIIHMTDVVEMQQLLSLAADEIERLRSRAPESFARSTSQESIRASALA